MDENNLFSYFYILLNLVEYLTYYYYGQGIGVLFRSVIFSALLTN